MLLKVQPCLKLDHSYKGPFTIQSLTLTNVVINYKLVGNESAEP